MTDNQPSAKRSPSAGEEVTAKHVADAGVTQRHERLLHRLCTARMAVWGGMLGIIILTLAGIFIHAKTPGSPSLELLRFALSTLATIVTLALGYIAGSNIESSK